MKIACGIGVRWKFYLQPLWAKGLEYHGTARKTHIACNACPHHFQVWNLTGNAIGASEGHSNVKSVTAAVANDLSSEQVRRKLRTAPKWSSMISRMQVVADGWVGKVLSNGKIMGIGTHAMLT